MNRPKQRWPYACKSLRIVPYCMSEGEVFAQVAPYLLCTIAVIYHVGYAWVVELGPSVHFWRGASVDFLYFERHRDGVVGDTDLGAAFQGDVVALGKVLKSPFHALRKVLEVLLGEPEAAPVTFEVHLP